MIRTRVGYTGGTTPDPTYHALGDHTEAIQVDFDPEVISYEDVLRRFWSAHDPTYCSRSVQYRNALWVHDEAQREVAEATKAEVAERLGREVETEILELGTFYLAENYHQKYRLRYRRQLTEDLQRWVPEGAEFVDSALTTRLNAYFARRATFEQVEAAAQREVEAGRWTEEEAAAVLERVRRGDP